MSEPYQNPHAYSQLHPRSFDSADVVPNTGNREALGLFNDFNSMQEAIKELEATAFPRDAISILGHRHILEERYGVAQSSNNPYAAEDDPYAPRTAPVRSEEQTIGASVLVGCAAYIGVVAAGLMIGPASVPITLMAIALGGGGGAAVAAALVSRLKHQYDVDIHEQIAKGGLLLWVRTPTPERETLACDILMRHNAHDVHVHEIPR
jgi:hypothetical protein